MSDLLRLVHLDTPNLPTGVQALLAHRTQDSLVLYELCGRQDYFQGYMLPSTGRRHQLRQPGQLAGRPPHRALHAQHPGAAAAGR